MARFVVSAALGATSGALLALAAPGPGPWPLAFVALVPWAIATRHADSSRARFAVDWICGAFFFVPTVIWLARIALAAFLPVAICAPLFVCLAGWIYRRLAGVLPSAVALPLAWLAGEVARGLPPQQFPWALLGYDVAPWLDLAGLAALGGPYLLTFLVASCSGAIVDLLGLGGAPRRRLPLLVVALAVAGGALLGARLRRDVGPLAEGPLVACVQPNIPQDLKDAGRPTLQDVSRTILRLVANGAEAGAELVVIPETLLPPWLARNLPPDAILIGAGSPSPLTAELARLDERDFLQILRERTRSAWLATGALLFDRHAPGDPRPRPRNSALLFDPSGREVARYDKVHLVPGSEALPLPSGGLADSFRRALDPFTGEMMIDMAPGDGARVFSMPSASGAEVRFAPTICYDNVFPDLFREAARAGAGFHLVLSNEGWFPDSHEMDAMLAYSAFRAIETRRAVLRCTNTGISCLVAPDGSLHSVLERNGRRSEIEGVFLARPPIGSATTPYLSIGDTPFELLAAASAGLAAVLALARRRERKARALAETRGGPP